MGEGEIADEDIREWWESGDSVTLITRPGRFGKTLNMSMLEKFFSVNYEDRGGIYFRGFGFGRKNFPKTFPAEKIPHWKIIITGNCREPIRFFS